MPEILKIIPGPETFPQGEDFPVAYNLLLIDPREKTIERLNIDYVHLNHPNIDHIIQQFLNPNWHYLGRTVFPHEFAEKPMGFRRFLMFYYLALRVDNPSLTGDQVLEYLKQQSSDKLSKEITKYIVSVKDKYVYRTGGKKKGIVMCHGYYHPANRLNLPKNVNWTLVDIDFQIIADYNEPDDLMRIGLGRWDYVVNQNCPSYNTVKDMEDFLRSAYQLLRWEGITIIPRLVEPEMNPEEFAHNTGYESFQVLNDQGDTMFIKGD